jgi:biopolymer transport protein ExbB/TolQ
MQNLLTDDSISNLIIIIIISALLLVFYIACYINFHTYRFLSRENKELDSFSGESVLLQEIESKFNEIKNKTENDINIQTFIEEYVSGFKHKRNLLKMVQDLKLIQTIGSTSILLGVLGTFIGLVFSISKIDGSLVENSIMGILNGIHTAFYTSIAGILVSIAISLMTRIWNNDHLLLRILLKIENRLILNNRKSVDMRLVDSMQDVKYSVEKMTSAFLSIENFSKGFEAASLNLNQFNDMFSANTQTLSSIFSDMEKFTVSFNTKMDSVDNHFASLISFMEKQEEIQAYSVDSLTKISTNLEQFMESQNTYQSKSESALHTVTETLDRTSIELKGYLSDNLDKLHGAFGAMSDFYEETIQSHKRLIQSQEAIEHKNTGLIETVLQATVTMRDVLESSSFEHIHEISMQFNTNIHEMNKQFADLISYFKNIEDVQQEYKILYGKVVNSMTQQDQNLQKQQYVLEAFGNTITSQNTEMVALFNTTQDYHKSFGDQSKLLTKEMGSSIEKFESIFLTSNEKMEEQTVKLNQALNEFVLLSNNSMKELMSKLDDSLGQNLQKSLRTFEKYVETTNQIIDLKFKAIVENSYIHNESNAYSMQSLQQSISSLDNNVKALASDIKTSMMHPVG